MRLASDPTTIYALGENFDGNLRRRDLPPPPPPPPPPRPTTPTAITAYRPARYAAPAVKLLMRLSNRAQTDYLYFVSRGNGRHQFSRSLKEHNRAVRKYQLKQ